MKTILNSKSIQKRLQIRKTSSLFKKGLTEKQNKLKQIQKRLQIRKTLNARQIAKKVQNACK